MCPANQSWHRSQARAIQLTERSMSSSWKIYSADGLHHRRACTRSSEILDYDLFHIQCCCGDLLEAYARNGPNKASGTPDIVASNSRDFPVSVSLIRRAASSAGPESHPPSTQAATSTAADKALTLLNGLLCGFGQTLAAWSMTYSRAQQTPKRKCAECRTARGTLPGNDLSALCQRKVGKIPCCSWPADWRCVHADSLHESSLTFSRQPDVAGEDRSDTATGSTRGQTTKIPKLNAVENSAPEHNSSGPHLDLDLFASGQMDGVNFPLDNPAGMAQTEDVLDYYDMLFRGGIPAGFSDSEDNLLPYEPSGSLSTD